MSISLSVLFSETTNFGGALTPSTALMWHALVQQNPERKSNGLYLKLMIVSPSQFDMVLLLLSGTVVDQELVSELYILSSTYLPFFHKGQCENLEGSSVLDTKQLTSQVSHIVQK